MSLKSLLTAHLPTFFKLYDFYASFGTSSIKPAGPFNFFCGATHGGKSANKAFGSASASGHGRDLAGAASAAGERPFCALVARATFEVSWPMPVHARMVPLPCCLVECEPLSVRLAQTKLQACDVQTEKG
jgi:hypothetical protein